VVLVGTSPLTRRVVAQCAREGIGTLVIGDDLTALDALRDTGTTIVYGQAARQDVLRAAHVDTAHALVLDDGTLADKIAISMAARVVNPRIAIVATASTAAEHAWLEEFGAAFVCDTLDGPTDSIVRSLRRTL
jgi:CPA2 family monovalent cation:H+ antiporter-2